MGKNNKPFEYECVKKCFEEKNYTLISKEYKNCKTNMKFICNFHKEFGEQEVNFTQLRKVKHNCILCRKDSVYENYRLDINKIKEKCKICGLEYVNHTHLSQYTDVEFLCIKHKDKEVQHEKITLLNPKRFNCKYCKEEYQKNLYKYSEDKMEEECNRFGLKYLGRYKKSGYTRVIFECPKHKGIVQESDYYNFRHSKYGCSYCANKHLTTKDLINHPNLQSNVIILGEYHKHNEKIKCQCKKCGGIWYATPNHLKSGEGCPKCKLSLGENELSIILKKMNIKYIPQHKFDECKYINNLLFDFYLPKFNVCIEYQRRAALSSCKIFRRL